MQVTTVEISRFRSIRSETLGCDALTVLVGANGAGKSSFLHALEVFYNIDARLTEEDFFARDTSQEIVIRVTYGNLRPDEEAAFSLYISAGQLTVTKRLVWLDGKLDQRYYAATRQFPPFAPLRGMKKMDQIEGWNKLVEAGAVGEGATVAKKGSPIDDWMNAFEVAHPDRLEPIEKETQFFGHRSVGGGKLDNFTKFVYLPAVRDITDDTAQARGTLSQLLDALVMRHLHGRPEVIAFKKEFQQRLRDIYEASQRNELAAMSNDISTTLQGMLPGSTFSIDFSEPQVPDLPLPAAIPRVGEDDFVGDISRKGHGLQRVLIFTLLQHLAVLRRDDEKEGTEAAAQPDGATAGPDLILAIEEPEIYQHPQRCRYLADLLLDLANSPDRGLGAQNQVLYTTHSPYFVGLDRFQNLRLARKSRDAGGGAPPFTTLASYGLEAAARELAGITGQAAESFSATTFRAHTYPIMTLGVSEGFFANGIVLVEGLSDAAVIWKVAELLGLEWVRRGIAVVPVSGKANLDRPAVVFRGLKIPTYVVFDGDVRHRGKAEQTATVQKNAACQRLVGCAQVEEFPPTRVEAAWACFEDCLETALRGELGEDVFDRLRNEVAARFGYDQPSQALKNFEAATCFVELAYTEGRHLPTLESIAQRVSAIAP